MRWFAAIVLVVALLAGGTVWLVLEIRAGRREHCARYGATPVPGGHGHFFCRTPDGRVVWP